MWSFVFFTLHRYSFKLFQVLHISDTSKRIFFNQWMTNKYKNLNCSQAQNKTGIRSIAILGSRSLCDEQVSSMISVSIQKDAGLGQSLFGERIFYLYFLNLMLHQRNKSNYNLHSALSILPICCSVGIFMIFSIAQLIKIQNCLIL